jgi:Protein of unknown function (DUF1559)
MRTLTRRRIVLGCSLLWLVAVIPASGQEVRAPEEESYPIVMTRWYPPIRVAAVEPDGTVRLVPARPQVGDGWPVTEGYYLITSTQVLTGQSPSPTSRPRDVAQPTKGAPRPPALARSPASRPLDVFVRVEVIDLGDNNTLTARVGPEAVTVLKAGDVVILVRPARMTTARIRALPAVIPLLKAGDPRSPQGPPDGIADVRQAARLSRSVSNLRQIGLAMQNFSTVYGQYPPAVVFGPDGKPWHSWRTLILQFIGEGPLYRQYDFSQPWDSPRNRALIDKMPPIYRDPQNGEAAGSHAHYAALVGEWTAFPPRGARITIADGVASDDLFKGIRVAMVTDGTSNTMAIAPVDPARKIPWTKPEDIEVGPVFPGLGQPGGIFTPARMGGVGVAPVLFLDGSVRTLSDRIDLATLRALTTRNGGEIIAQDKVAGPLSTPILSNNPGRALHLIRVGETVSAWIGPATAP